MSWKSDGPWYGHKVHEYQSDDGIRMRATRHWSSFIEFKMMSMPWDTRAEKFARDLEVNVVALGLLYKELDEMGDEATSVVGRIKYLEDKIGNRAPLPTTGNEVLQRPVGIHDPAVAEQGG